MESAEENVYSGVVRVETTINPVESSLQHRCGKLLKNDKFEADLDHAMDFTSFELFSVAYLELYSARKFETQQTYKQTIKHAPRRQRFTHHPNKTFCHHLITLFNP